MGLFLSKKHSKRVLVGVVLSSGLVSAANHGVVGAVLKTGVNNSSESVSNVFEGFLKDNWGKVLVILGVILVLGFGIYKYFPGDSKKKVIESVKNKENVWCSAAGAINLIFSSEGEELRNLKLKFKVKVNDFEDLFYKSKLDSSGPVNGNTTMRQRLDSLLTEEEKQNGEVEFIVDRIDVTEDGARLGLKFENDEKNSLFQTRALVNDTDKLIKFYNSLFEYNEISAKFFYIGKENGKEKIQLEVYGKEKKVICKFVLEDHMSSEKVGICGGIFLKSLKVKDTPHGIGDSVENFKLEKHPLNQSDDVSLLKRFFCTQLFLFSDEVATIPVKNVTVKELKEILSSEKKEYEEEYEEDDEEDDEEEYKEKLKTLELLNDDAILTLTYVGDCSCKSNRLVTAKFAVYLGEELRLFDLDEEFLTNNQDLNCNIIAELMEKSLNVGCQFVKNAMEFNIKKKDNVRYLVVKNKGTEEEKEFKIGIGDSGCIMQINEKRRMWISKDLLKFMRCGEELPKEIETNLYGGTLQK